MTIGFSEDGGAVVTWVKSSWLELTGAKAEGVASGGDGGESTEWDKITSKNLYLWRNGVTGRGESQHVLIITSVIELFTPYPGCGCLYETQR